MGKFLQFYLEARKTRREDEIVMNGFHLVFKRVFNKDQNGKDTTPMYLINGELTTDGNRWGDSAWRFDHGTDDNGNEIKIAGKKKYVTQTKFENAKCGQTNEICGVFLKAPTEYPTSDETVSFHKETVGNKVFLVDNTGTIRIQLTQTNNKRTTAYVASIVEKYKKYLKSTGEQIDLRTYITNVYIPHRIDKDKDKRKEIINQLKSVSDNNSFIYGKLEVDGNFVRMYKWPDEKAVRIVDTESNQLVRVNLSKLIKVKDGVYKMPYYQTPESIKFVKQKIFPGFTVKKAQEVIAAERVEKLWQQKEDKIAQNLRKIFGDKNRLISNTPVDVDVERVGGGNKSDIRITNKATKKSFFIESKLNYSSSEYFKFHLLLQRKNLLHNADSKLGKNRQDTLNGIFGSNSSEQADTFLSLLMSGGNKTIVRKQIDQFYENIGLFLNQSSKWIDGDDKTQVGKLKQDFFKTAKPIYTDKSDIQNMVFPTDLVKLVQCFSEYLQFIRSMKDRIQKNNKNISEDKNKPSKEYDKELYSQMLQNLGTLFNNKKLSDVEGFVDDITDNMSDGNEVLTKIYKKIISGVESDKNKNTYNLMLFKTSDTQIIPGIIDKINSYYTKVHDCRYLEIGIHPFTKTSVFNKDSWKSHIFVLEPDDTSKVGYDPLCLVENKSEKVFTVQDMKKIKVANIFCQISSDLTCFSLKVFLGTDAKTEEGSDLFIPSGSSFEEMEQITLVGEPRF